MNATLKNAGICLQSNVYADHFWTCRNRVIFLISYLSKSTIWETNTFLNRETGTLYCSRKNILFVDNLLFLLCKIRLFRNVYRRHRRVMIALLVSFHFAFFLSRHLFSLCFPVRAFIHQGRRININNTWRKSH